MIDHSQLHTCQSATQRTSQETTFDHDRRPVSRCFRSRFLLHTFTLEFILLQFMCREQAFDGLEVHDGLLRPRLRHCSSPASAVRRLPSAVRTATPAFHVRSSGLFYSRPGGLQLVTRLPARSLVHVPLTVFART